MTAMTKKPKAAGKGPAIFRRIALGFPETEERSHMNHPDFRVAGKIFATLGYPDASRGMVKLTPEQQETFVHDHPDSFAPVKGGWGLKGATSVFVNKVSATVLRTVLYAAWSNTAPKSVLDSFREDNPWS